MSNKYHKSGGKYDEYYTTMEEVEYIFENIIPQEKLIDKIIYCFCDSEQSAFVIYLKNHPEIGYKELIYTSDDYNNHMDLFERADIYITNPPFSKIYKEIIPILNKYNKDYFLFGSLAMVNAYREHIEKELYIYRRPKYFHFIMGDVSEQTGTNKVFVSLTVYFSTFPLNNIGTQSIKQAKFENIKKVWADTEQGKILNIDFLRNLPIDYKEKMLVPLSILLNPMYDQIKSWELYRGVKSYDDGRNRYVRILIEMC